MPRLDECDKGSLEKLQQQLQKKDSQLTESRLEALSSAHQLHTLRETVVSLRQEMTRLKVENEKIYQTKTKTPDMSQRKNYKTETVTGPSSMVSVGDKLAQSFNIRFCVISSPELAARSSGVSRAVETGRVAPCSRSPAVWSQTWTRS